MPDGMRGEQRYGGLTCEEVGDLAPAFVLDALPADEADRLRAHLQACPEVHPELAELGSAVPALARSVATAQPPSDLGARIVAAARAERAAAIAAGEVEPASLPAVPMPAPQPVARRTFRFLDALRTPRWAAAGIAAILILALGAWNLQLQGQMASLSAYRDGVAEVLDTAAAPGAQVAVLRAPASQAFMLPATGLAAVDPAGRLVIAMHDLPATTGPKVYEAWLIGADGKPVPAGSFSVGSGGVGTLTGTVGSGEAGVVVALTLEAGPGATTPTLPVLIEGKASAPAT